MSAAAPPVVESPPVGGVPDLDDFAKQEIRIAAVLNGGVSLAVWMSGVTIELHHVALAAQGLGPWRTYREIADVLGAVVRVDVIAGTSAGGLNGSFLALGQARRRDLALLRDLWTDDGSLEALLRPALEKSPPSLMRGDDYFLVRIREALTQLAGDANRVTPSTDAPPIDVPPVELILTGTLWSGRTSTFTDDMGVAITERDYDATFHFANQVRPENSGAAGDLDGDTAAIVEQLAQASRCTSSFPAAFEPHLVTRLPGAGVDDRTPTSAGQANFDTEQYVLDGGILLNQPVRPALDAIYRQPGGNEVRRVLAYVVPDPGEPPPAHPDGRTKGPGPVPDAASVLLGVLTRLRSTDSVARELTEIRDRNADAYERKNARARLSRLLNIGGPKLVEGLWDGYGAARLDSATQTIGRLIAQGQGQAADAWSEQEITAGLARVAASPIGFPFVPQSGLSSALAAEGNDWEWGQTTVNRLVDMTTDVFRRTLTLAPLDDAPGRRLLVEQRRAMGATGLNVLAGQRDLIDFWLSAAAGTRGLPRIPNRDGAADGGTASNTYALDDWLGRVVVAWDPLPSAVPSRAAAGMTHRDAQYAQAIALATSLLSVRDAIDTVLAAPNKPMDPDGSLVTKLRALADWLLPAEVTTPKDVLSRMLQLDVVLVATAGVMAHVEQEVELVQVSCSDRTVITGMQLHHFGAFYRAPWRVNDWIEGRLDGARQAIRFVLSPARLRQRGFDTPGLIARLTKIAVPDDVSTEDREFLQTMWVARLPAVTTEVGLALSGSSPRALDALAEALALPVFIQILRDDLGALAKAIHGELEDAMPGSRQWLSFYDAAVKARGHEALSAATLWDLRQQMHRVGNETIAQDVGSDTFARTVSHTATVAASAFSATPKIGAVKPIAGLLRAVRGYTAVVWAMVAYQTRRSAIGARAVSAAVAVGGTLLALAIFVPAVPLGITLAGAVLVLAGASAAALRTPTAHGLGRRLVVVAVVVAIAFAALIWWEIHEHGFSSNVLGVLIKIGVGVVIVSLGWFLARSRPSKS